MKVLFLDIDGVVNFKGSRTMHLGMLGIDPELAFRVGKIILDTGCEVVLSSAWRNWPEGVVEVEKRIHKLFDKTPRVASGYRGDEVALWLKDHPEVTRYAIVDDDSDFHPTQPLFQTSWETGITEEIAKNITDYLNGEGDGESKNR